PYHCYNLTHTSIFFLSTDPQHLRLKSFPTRRSSDLTGGASEHTRSELNRAICVTTSFRTTLSGRVGSISNSTLTITRSCCDPTSDRKSTRLNSSHLGISYAVFCLKKKNKNTPTTDIT